MLLIDGLQYCNWSEKIFKELKLGKVTAIHVTITYHENFRETVHNIEKWNRWFEAYPDLIFQGFTAQDITVAQETHRTAVFFGSQNPSCIEDDIGLVEVLHRLGLRFMQLTYNNQSLLATGCYEACDSGLTRMGRAVVEEMNRVGLVIDMSHSGNRSTLEAIEHSARPIAITHANPSSWHPALRNKSDDVISALSQTNGMLGFSIYPHHLNNAGNCTLVDFCEMIARTAEKFGVNCLGIGSDLCQDQPDGVVAWMRTGRWTKGVELGEGSAAVPGFPEMPEWFKGNKDLNHISRGLAKTGMSEPEICAIMGGNWTNFFKDSFQSQQKKFIKAA